MDFLPFLREASATLGVSGHEAPIAAFFAGAFRPLTDEVSVDSLENVAARAGDSGPRIMMVAHQDEIGMIVSKIEKDGSLRLYKMGGVDPRILPAARVFVHTRDAVITGVVGAKPPHLLSQADQKKSVQFKDLFVDVGLDFETAQKRVRVGDLITLRGEPAMLSGGQLVGKTMDDRACVAIMLEAAERLKTMRAPCQALYLVSSQEEVGSRGAKTGAFAQKPDAAIILDVTHADTRGAEKRRTVSIDKPVLYRGPSIHPGLFDAACKIAEAHHVEYSVKVSAGRTGTDTDNVQISRAGVPTLLISVPLRYMHTTVEIVSEPVLRETGRLLAHLVDEIARGWEEISWN